MNRSARERRAGYPTLGVAMRNGDTAKSSRAGIEFDTNGQPAVLNAAGGAIYDTDSSGQPQIKNAAGTIMLDLSSSLGRVPVVIKLAIPVQVALTGVLAGGSLLNPFGYDVIITTAVFRVTTQSTGASTMDIGIAADATTSNDGIFDAVVGTATGIFNNEDNAGTNGRSAIVWGSAQYLNVAEASGDVAGIIADLFVTCYRA